MKPKQTPERTTADFATDDRVTDGARQGKVVGTLRGQFVGVLWDGESQVQHLPHDCIRVVPKPPKQKGKPRGRPFQPVSEVGEDWRRYKLTPEHGRRGYEATVEKFMAAGCGEVIAKKRVFQLICKKEQ